MECEVTTHGMAPTGEAIAHVEMNAERRAVFVQGAAENETLRVRFDPTERPLRAVVMTIVRASSDRVPAPCTFSAVAGGPCGGCDWMHLSRDAQRAHHLRHVKEATGQDAAFHRAERDLGWRGRARLHIVTKPKVRVGFFGPRSHEPAVVSRCLILDPRLDDARGRVANLLLGARGDGEASLALGRTKQPVLFLSWSRELPAEVIARIDAAVAKGEWGGARLQCGDARRPADIGDPTPCIDGADGMPLELPPGGFSQAHTELNLALARRVRELVPTETRTVELYAGAGNFSTLLAKDNELQAVESNEAACECARRNLAARSLQARVTCADAASFKLPGGVANVVLDPPRTGAREACERLLEHRVKRVVYVSCDLATLRRDLGILGAAYEIASVDAFEMFPHTSHVETVVSLTRKRK